MKRKQKADLKAYLGKRLQQSFAKEDVRSLYSYLKHQISSLKAIFKTFEQGGFSSMGDVRKHIQSSLKSNEELRKLLFDPREELDEPSFSVPFGTASTPDAANDAANSAGCSNSKTPRVVENPEEIDPQQSETGASKEGRGCDGSSNKKSTLSVPLISNLKPLFSLQSLQDQRQDKGLGESPPVLKSSDDEEDPGNEVMAQKFKQSPSILEKLKLLKPLPQTPLLNPLERLKPQAALEEFDSRPQAYLQRPIIKEYLANRWARMKNFEFRPELAQKLALVDSRIATLAEYHAQLSYILTDERYAEIMETRPAARSFKSYEKLETIANFKAICPPESTLFTFLRRFFNDTNPVLIEMEDCQLSEAELVRKRVFQQEDKAWIELKMKMHPFCRSRFVTKQHQVDTIYRNQLFYYRYFSFLRQTPGSKVQRFEGSLLVVDGDPAKVPTPPDAFVYFTSDMRSYRNDPYLPSMLTMKKQFLNALRFCLQVKAMAIDSKTSTFPVINFQCVRCFSYFESNNQLKDHNDLFHPPDEGEFPTIWTNGKVWGGDLCQANSPYSFLKSNEVTDRFNHGSQYVCLFGCPPAREFQDQLISGEDIRMHYIEKHNHDDLKLWGFNRELLKHELGIVSDYPKTYLSQNVSLSFRRLSDRVALIEYWDKSQKEQPEGEKQDPPLFQRSLTLPKRSDGTINLGPDLGTRLTFNEVPTILEQKLLKPRPTRIPQEPLEFIPRTAKPLLAKIDFETGVLNQTEGFESKVHQDEQAKAKAADEDAFAPDLQEAERLLSEVESLGLNPAPEPFQDGGAGLEPVEQPNDQTNPVDGEDNLFQDQEPSSFRMHSPFDDEDDEEEAMADMSILDVIKASGGIRASHVEEEFVDTDQWQDEQSEK